MTRGVCGAHRDLDILHGVDRGLQVGPRERLFDAHSVSAASDCSLSNGEHEA